jgi:hypothetical protein
MQGSVIARVPNEPIASPLDDGGGWDDYAGPFDPHFELEHLSHRALQIVVREFTVQAHLLARAMMCAVERRHTHDEAIAVGRSLFEGIGWIGAQRLTAALAIEPGDPGALATVLPLTNLLLPADYVGVTVERAGDATTITLRGDASGLTEGDPYSLPGLLELGADEIIESLVHGVDPTATVTPAESPGAVRAWTVRAGAAAPADVPGPVELVRLSTGVNVTLRRRVPLPAAPGGA